MRTRSKEQYVMNLSPRLAQIPAEKHAKLKRRKHTVFTPFTCILTR